jgi:hypothetical protein
MKDRKSVITFPILEGSLPGHEETTEALGEENPTTTSGENPSPALFQGPGRRGGPFGAF